MAREERLMALAQASTGLRYDSPEARAILDERDWVDYWPDCDASGLLLGGIVGSGDTGEYANVDDLAMVRWDALPAAEQRRIQQSRDDGTYDGHITL